MLAVKQPGAHRQWLCLCCHYLQLPAAGVHYDSSSNDVLHLRKHITMDVIQRCDSQGRLGHLHAQVGAH